MPARFVDLVVVHPVSRPSQHFRPVCLHIDSYGGVIPRHFRGSRRAPFLPPPRGARLCLPSAGCREVIWAATVEVDSGGMHKGGGSPSCGGSRLVLAAWGEPSRPGFPPEGETGKGAIKPPCCRRHLLAHYARIPPAYALPASPYGHSKARIPTNFTDNPSQPRSDP